VEQGDGDSREKKGTDREGFGGAGEKRKTVQCYGYLAKE